jgi:thioredoxin 1
MEILNNKTFDEYINKEERVIINFSAEWCGPCRMMKPLLEKVSGNYEGRLAKIDVDQSPEISSKYGIRGIPSFLVFEKGELVEKKTGAINEKELISLF